MCVCVCAARLQLYPMKMTQHCMILLIANLFSYGGSRFSGLLHHMVGYFFKMNVLHPSSGIWGYELIHNHNPEDSAVSRQWAGCWRNCRVIPSMAKRSMSFHNDPDWPWCPSAICTMGAGWWYGRGVKLITLFSAEVKNKWLYISTPLYVFMWPGIVIHFL